MERLRWCSRFSGATLFVGFVYNSFDVGFHTFVCLVIVVSFADMEAQAATFVIVWCTVLNYHKYHICTVISDIILGSTRTCLTWGSTSSTKLLLVRRRGTVVLRTVLRHTPCNTGYWDHLLIVRCSQ